MYNGLHMVSQNNPYIFTYMCVECYGGPARVLRLAMPVVEVVAERVGGARVQQLGVRRVAADGGRQQAVDYHVCVPGQ